MKGQATTLEFVELDQLHGQFQSVVINGVNSKPSVLSEVSQVAPTTILHQQY